MTFFGFFKGMKYGKCEDDFDDYKKIKNHIEVPTEGTVIVQDKDLSKHHIPDWT